MVYGTSSKFVDYFDCACSFCQQVWGRPFAVTTDITACPGKWDHQVEAVVGGTKSIYSTRVLTADLQKPFPSLPVGVLKPARLALSSDSTALFAT
jgi:hypothetical protein